MVPILCKMCAYWGTGPEIAGFGRDSLNGKRALALDLVGAFLFEKFQFLAQPPRPIEPPIDLRAGVAGLVEYGRLCAAATPERSETGKKGAGRWILRSATGGSNQEFLLQAVVASVHRIRRTSVNETPRVPIHLAATDSWQSGGCLVQFDWGSTWSTCREILHTDSGEADA